MHYILGNYLQNGWIPYAINSYNYMLICLGTALFLSYFSNLR